MDFSHLLLASTSAGTIVGLISTPFDVVKNLWQFNSIFTENRGRSNLLNVISYVYRSHGIKGFWKGIYPAWGVLVPTNFVFFSLYERLILHDPAYWAGIQSRAAAVVVVAPMEYVRTKLQATVINEGAFNITKRAILEEGVFSLWRGVLPTLVRDVPFSAVFWQVNDTAWKWIKRGDKNFESRSKTVKSLLFPFTVGACSAGVACLLSHPFDVVKTNMQATDRIEKKRGFIFVKRESALRIANRIFKTEGCAGFFVGFIPRFLKLIPSNAVMLATYEYSKVFFEK